MRLISIYIIFFLVSCFMNDAFTQNTTQYKYVASYYPYTTAMGKGKGVIFKIMLSAKDKKLLTIDSFFVKNMPIKFSTKTLPDGILIEANYLSNTPELSMNPDGTTNTSQITEDVITSQLSFYPSWLIIKKSGKRSRVAITHFTASKKTQKN